jgi:hypothetical protein
MHEKIVKYAKKNYLICKKFLLNMKKKCTKYTKFLYVFIKFKIFWVIFMNCNFYNLKKKQNESYLKNYRYLFVIIQ